MHLRGEGVLSLAYGSPEFAETRWAGNHDVQYCILHDPCEPNFGADGADNRRRRPLRWARSMTLDHY